MLEKKIKIICLLLSYSFFICIIIISINAVVPDEELPILEPKDVLVKKIENNFSRNKNSAYEILEENKENQIDKNADKVILKKQNEKNEATEFTKQNNNFRLQFASFKEKQKSLKTVDELNLKFSKMSLKINLTVKEVKVNDKEIFFRIISEDYYSFLKANNHCKILKNNKIQCIIIKS